jgi:hypothetical protein
VLASVAAPYAAGVITNPATPRPDEDQSSPLIRTRSPEAVGISEGANTSQASCDANNWASLGISDAVKEKPDDGIACPSECCYRPRTRSRSARLRG